MKSQTPWKHTFGAVRSPNDKLVALIFPTQVEDDNGDFYWQEGKEAEFNANANMVAAAPDLYEALLLARAIMNANNINAPKTFGQIDAAILKAKGEI